MSLMQQGKPFRKDSEWAIDSSLVSKTEVVSHHPGYQTLRANSWWCDDCLDQCSQLPLPKTDDESQWYDFLPWLSGLLVKGFATVLTALFFLVLWIIGREEWYQGLNIDLKKHYQCKWERELNWLIVRRERLLFGIDTLRAQQAKAYRDGLRPTPAEIENSIARLNADLDDTMVKIHALEIKVSEEPSEFDHNGLIMAQMRAINAARNS